MCSSDGLRDRYLLFSIQQGSGKWDFLLSHLPDVLGHLCFTYQICTLHVETRPLLLEWQLE